MEFCMPWSERIKTKLCRYLLQRYLGHILKEKLTLEQLTLNLYEGTGTIKDVLLDVEYLNELLEAQGAPLEIVDGFVGCITGNVPWSAFISDSTTLTVKDLQITLQPRQRAQDNTGASFDSMFESTMMTSSSMDLATEFVGSDGEASLERESESSKLEGLNRFAWTIEAVLTKVQVTFEDTVVRIEHLPKLATKGAALEIRIDRISYFDELCKDEPTRSTTDTYERAAFLSKNLHFKGITIFCDEFLESQRTFSRENTASYGSSPVSDRSGRLSSPSSEENMIPVERDDTSESANSAEGPNSSPVHSHSDPIKIVVFTGTQEIKLKMKQNEQLAGPKVEFDCNFGSVNAHLSPRQVHLLTEVVQGIAEPDLCDNSNVRSQGTLNKPMSTDDFQKIERDLQQQLHHGQMSKGQGLRDQGTWGHDSDPDFLQTQPLDDSDDEFYYELSEDLGDDKSMDGSMCSGTTTNTKSTINSTSMIYNQGAGYSVRESPFQATLPKGTRSNSKPGRQKDSLHKLLDDPTVEPTKIRMKLQFLSVVVLHDDPVATPGDGLDPPETSWQQLHVSTERYFGSIFSLLGTVGTDPDDLIAMRQKITDACPYDHISLLMKPLLLECQVKQTTRVNNINVNLTVGIAELVECVIDRCNKKPIFGINLPIDNIMPDYCELLTFSPADVDDAMHTSMSSAPVIQLTINSVYKTDPISRQSSIPRVNISLDLASCHSELDITIVDRIQSLLKPQPLVPTSANLPSGIGNVNRNTLYQNQQAYMRQQLDDAKSTTERKINLTVTCTSIEATIRFPIPDLRSGQSVDRMPWWKRSLRKEVLVALLTDPKLKISFCSNPEFTIEVMCKEIEGIFKENYSCDQTVPFVKVTSAEMSNREDGFDWPRVVVKIYPEVNSVLIDAEQEENNFSSFNPESYHYDHLGRNPTSSPFSSKRVMYDNEELVIPGDASEMSAFQESASNHTKLYIDFTLPCVSAQLPDKTFFELLYNRINNDLLLWEPLAPAPIDIHDSYNHIDQTLTPLSPLGNDKFQMCKSAAQYDSSSESDESVDDYSLREQKLMQRRKQLQEGASRQSDICVGLNVGRGRIEVHTPLVVDNEISKSHHGEFLVDVREASVFCSVKHNGDPELRYVSVSLQKGTLYHSGSVPTVRDPFDTNPYPCGPISSIDSPIPAHLTPTIYISERGVTTHMPTQQDTTQAMLTLALKIKMDAIKNLKEFQVSFGVRGSTLHHKMYNTGQSWLTQLLDFFDVQDFPILGYKMPTVMTELHFHMWDCAIDYRPLYFPYRSMLTVESFTISSNVIAESAASVLRFIIEDAALYISDNCTASCVDLLKNYVCVVDVGLFELSLRSTDGKDPSLSKSALCASNNIVHIRTCWDSCRALADLIVYIANDGDLTTSCDNSDSTTASNGSSVIMNDDVSADLQDSQIDQVHDLMADAMQENEDDLSPGGDPKDLFQFTDEAALQDSQDPQEIVPDLQLNMVESFPAPTDTELTAHYGKSGLYSDDDEFCIIDEPWMGSASRDNEPIIKVLVSDPITIHDNHFSIPQGQTDQLKAPEHFPQPVYIYTLNEMSLVWYMYGGNDFNNNCKKEKQSNTPAGSYSSCSSSDGSYSNPGHRLGQIAWRARGGHSRNVNVLMELQLNKVRMQYEIYPENTEQASRQIISINEIEIRDRLSASKINKFLYQYASDELPRQSHASMLLIKALHTRPDKSLPATQECAIRVSMLPLRFNIDQDSLNFLRNFFSMIVNSSMDDIDADSDVNSGGHSRTSPRTSVSHTAPPVMNVGKRPTAPDSQEIQVMFDEITGDLYDDAMKRSATATAGTEPAQQPIYVKSFIFSPDVPIRLDYNGKHVDVGQGIMGVLVGIAQLNCSRLTLVRINHRHGLLGIEKTILFAVTRWLEDIKSRQLATIMGGIGPMYSLVQFTQGIRDLVYLPIEQYQKDGRIVRGIQRGAQSFTMCTAMASLELTNRLVVSIQYAAELAFDMVSPGPSVRVKKKQRRQIRKAPPADIREGVANAYYVVKDGIQGTASTIYTVAISEHEHKGYTGAVGGVLRQIPPTVIQPVILATEATSNVLGGMRNQLKPDRRREDQEKWKPDDDSQ